MPAVLQPVASVLPLSFVVSGLREIIVNGLSIAEQIPTAIGLAVWLVISLLLAIKLFVWKEVAT
jgi:ABC-type multidrug transport system permease subunit